MTAENVRKVGAIKDFGIGGFAANFSFSADSKTVKGPVVEQLPKILERCSQIGNVVLICIGNLRAAYCCGPKNILKYYDLRVKR